MRFIELAIRNIKEVYRDPLSISLGVAMPAVLIVLFASLGKKTAIDIFTANMLSPAITVFSFGFLTMFSAMLLAKDRQSALLARLLTTPLKSSDFILAYILPFIPIAILQITVCFATGALFGIMFNGSVGLAFFVLLLMAVACIGLGIIMGSLFTENQVSGVGSMVIVSISLFGGCWMDLEMVGGVFQGIGYALPFAHAIDATRDILMGSGFSDIATDFYWVLGYTVIFFVLGILCFGWRTKG